MAKFIDILEIGHPVEKPTQTDFKDIESSLCGRWRVIEYRGSKNWSRYWLCQCSCKARTLRLFKTGNINISRSASCGCLKSEESKEVRTSDLPEWKVWAGIKSRCYNTSRKDYPRYGGRGITICERWLESFENFYEDMGPRPIEDKVRFSLDRKNNDLGYYKENCRWATDKEQANNRRKNVFLEYNGKTKTMSQWAEIFGIKQSILGKRIRNGWSVKDALNIKPGERLTKESNKLLVYLEYDEKRLTFDEWSNITGIKRHTIACRYYKGWSNEKILTTPIKHYYK